MILQWNTIGITGKDEKIQEDEVENEHSGM